MQVAGIVVEYNPFHNGHIHHLNEVKKHNPDLVIAIMSGHFTQRGDIAIIDKMKRTHIALQYGVDLVIELPYPYATSSADLFSQGAIRLLNEVGMTDLYFGSESNNLENLKQAAALQKSEQVQIKIKERINKGESYPHATLEVLKKALKEDSLSPNDILGIQYINAINTVNPHINIHPIKRIDHHYHDTSLSNTSISSATSIRRAVQEGKDITRYVPIEIKEALDQEIHTWEQYFPYLKYQIIAQQNRLSFIHDMTEGLHNRMLHYIHQSDDMTTFLNHLTSKRHTESKMRRLCCHVLNQFTTDDFNNKHDYIRILGLNEAKSRLIKQAMKSSQLPIITNITKRNHALIEQELKVDALYHLGDIKRIRKIPIIMKKR